MIILKIWGGLGNQMFQYAFGRNLAKKLKTNLKLDITYNKIKKFRHYSLKHFNIVEHIASDEELHNFQKINKKCLFKLINAYLPIKKKKYVRQNDNTFNSNYFNTNDNSYLDGYWQSEKYFRDISNIIKQELTLKPKFNIDKKSITTRAQSANSVSIHVRRGDYITNKAKSYWSCSPEYYYRAVDLMAKKLNNIELFLFSDDPDWAKQNLKLKFPTYYIAQEKLKDYEELILMSHCRHNIIANSSFSWWGAWLNNNPNKMVIAPQKWFKNPDRQTTDLIPNSWIKL